MIVGAISDHCNCTYSVGYITDEHFLCSNGSSTYVTYRATIHGTKKKKAETLAGYIQDFISMGGNFNSNFTIDSDCRVLIDSFNDPLCSDNDNIKDDDISSDTSSYLLIVIVVAGAVSGVSGLFLSAVIIVLCICCKNKPKR